MPSLDVLRLDLRLALRAVLRDRGFGIAALLMLALCIALNATACRVLNTMLLRGYPLVKDNDRLLYIDERSPQAGCWRWASAWRSSAVCDPLTGP